MAKQTKSKSKQEVRVHEDAPVSKQGEKPREGSVSFDAGSLNRNLRAIIEAAVDAQNVIDSKSSSISNRLLEAAKATQKAADVVQAEGNETGGGKPDPAKSDGFLAACELQEKYIRSSDAGEHQVEKLPRCWTQAKSNIKQALRFGIDLKKYTSESALRKRVVKLRGQTVGDPLKARLNDLRDKMLTLPVAEAEGIILELEAAVNAALQGLVPVQPEKNEDQDQKDAA